MGRIEEERLLKKRLLQARCALYRLKLRHEAGALRDSLSWRQVAVTVASSSTAQSAGFDLALEVLGPSRMSRFLALASNALMVARIANIVLAALRSRPAAPPET
jgi:hypothetical protein